MIESNEVDGYRIHLVEDTVALDNRPLTARAREEGRPDPEPERIVVPQSVMREAFRMMVQAGLEQVPSARTRG